MSGRGWHISAIGLVLLVELLPVTATAQDTAETLLQQLLTPASLTQPSRHMAATSAARLTGIVNRLTELRRGARGISCKQLDIRFNSQAIPCELFSGFLPYEEGGGQRYRKSDYLFSHLGGFFAGQLEIAEFRDQQGSGLSVAPRNLLLGVDEQLTDRLLVGMAVGYDQRNPAYADTLGSFDKSSLSLSLYSNYALHDRLFVDLASLYSRSQIDSSRQLSMTSGLQSSYSAHELALSVGSGLVLARTGSSQLDLQARLGYQRIMAGSYRASLSSGEQLNIVQQDYEMLNTHVSLGWRASYLTRFGHIQSVGKVAWQRSFLPAERQLQASFRDIPGRFPGADMTARSEDEQAVLLNLGLDSRLSRNLSAFLRYETGLGLTEQPDQRFDLNLRMDL